MPGALIKYFGKIAGDDEFKLRGIEARQRSTPAYIETVQRECLEQLDATRSSAVVLGCLQDAIERLHAGEDSMKIPQLSAWRDNQATGIA